MHTISTVDDINNIVLKDNQMVDILKVIRDLNLQDWYLGAGFVRNKVWNLLHDLNDASFIEDLDVVYFNTSDTSKETDIKLEEELNYINPNLKWTVKNQARMHTRNFHTSYIDTEDGIRHWTETATCIGVRIELNNRIQMVAPYGIKDLVNLILRPTPYSGINNELFFERINRKGWLQRWTKLKIILTNE